MSHTLKKILQTSSDGSLPEIEVIFKDLDSAKKFVSSLVIKGSITKNSVINSKGRDQDCYSLNKTELINMLNIGHHLNIVNLGNIPELGISIYPKSIGIDFQTGPDWTEDSIIEFELLLKNAKKDYNAISMVLDEENVKFSETEKLFFDKFSRKL